MEKEHKKEMDPVTAALNLSYHLPTTTIGNSIQHMCTLNNDVAQELLSEIDQPLSVIKPIGNDVFIASDYNRNGDCYRIPLSFGSTPKSYNGGNFFYADGEQSAEQDRVSLSEYLSKVEAFANDAFKVYISQYFTQGSTLSNVYCWEKNAYNEGDEVVEIHEGENGDGRNRVNHFGMAVLFHKASEEELRKTSDLQKQTENDLWDGIHIISVDFVEQDDVAKTITYKYTINSTVITYLFIEGEGRLQLAGKVSKQKEHIVVHSVKPKLSRSIHEQHITAAIGPQIEEIETELLNYINDIYFSGTCDVLAKLRSADTLEERTRRQRDQSSIANDMKIRNAFFNKVKKID